MNPPDRSSLALQTIALLEGLAQPRLVALARQCRWHSVDAHHALLRRSDPQHEVYFLLSGRVRVTSYSAGGRQVSFRDVAPGDYFGDLSAIDGQPRSADVVTLEPSVVASLGGADFIALLREEPLVAERALRNLVALVRQTSERVIELSTLGVNNRLHAELLRRARAAGVDAQHRARLDPAPQHEALASQISTGREQVTRELNALVRGGLLAKDGKALVILDVERLARLVAEVHGP
jgi:CRP-like cAMP-binding protein